MSIVLREISHEIVASKLVVRKLYEKAAGTAEFDSDTQRKMMDPGSPKFSAAYLAAFAFELLLVPPDSTSNPLRFHDKRH